MRRAFSQAEKGQSLVLMALSILVLSGMVALSVDAGNAFSQRRLLQTAADAAAMAGAHLALEQLQTTTDYQKQKDMATLFANLNGRRASDTLLIEWVDGNGVAFPNVGGLPSVGGGTVQGMKVTITANRATFLFNILGISTLQVKVTAMAQFGTPTGLRGAIPLALNCDSVPGSGCPPSTSPPPTLYQPVIMTAQNGGPAVVAGTPDSLGYPIPAAFNPSPSAANFFVLHDPPTSPTSLATETSAWKGLTTTLQLGPSYYVEDNAPATEGFVLGLNDRIQDSRNNAVFSGDKPVIGGFSPLNPRVFLVAINKAAGANPCTPPPNCIVLDEYLAFYLEFVLYTKPAGIYSQAGGITLGGYFVAPNGVPGANGFGNPTAPGPKIFRLTR